MPPSDHASLGAASLGTARQGARHGMCEITSAADLPGFGFFRLLHGHSRKLITRMLLPVRVRLIVLMTMQTADCTEHELTLKFKPVFMLLLNCVSIVCSSFDCLWAETV
jgi:hypothetical protein